MSLVDPSDNVIRLADGTVIGADGKQVKPRRPLTEIPSNTEARKIVVKANRRIADLPALPDKMNGISVILVYSMFGMADQEIAIATGLTTEQIEVIRTHDAYATMLEQLQKNVIEADQDIIRKTIHQHTHTALANVVDKISNAENEKVSLAASQDLLDRAGYRPADIVEHTHKLEGTLRIIHVDRKSTSNIPTLDAFGNPER